MTGVEAEAELLSAAVQTFIKLGLGPTDVGIKVNSRKILSSILELANVHQDKFAATCVLIDKLEKVPLEALSSQFVALGLSMDQVEMIVNNLKPRDLTHYSALLGPDSPGVQDLSQLYSLAKSYGYDDWLVFDPSVVRGLAYYTGIVFEGFDRQGQFRAIMGGGRYDALLESFGDEKIPAVGFGFGDAVIVELLKSKSLLPDTSTNSVQIVVYAMVETLRTSACAVVNLLRESGYSVDFVLQQKKPKWVFQHADKINASLVVMFAEEEHSKGQVVVKSMSDGKQTSEDVSTLLTVVQNALQRDNFR